MEDAMTTRNPAPTSGASSVSSGARAQPVNPYGGGPGAGLSLPPYYHPTRHVKNNNFFYPGLEEVGPDEMRISFVGSCPWPSRRNQAGTSIMVELGNGDIFFFDLGNGSVHNIIAMGVPPGLINDIFISHLHVDHFADLPYMLPFTATNGRFLPLRVTGPSGRTPELGTAAMVDSMRSMLRWHFDDFDFRERNGICYEKNGVTVRHWPRSHGKDGASAYRLDWNGLSFVWTGDGRPDELTIEYSQGVDVFVTEVQNDLGRLMSLKMGYPPAMYNYIVDTHHTTEFAAGYLFKEINPRIGMVTHLEYEPELAGEVVAGIRAHWDGLFVIGAPDVRVVNVTPDAVWARDAVLPDLGSISMPPPAAMMKMLGLDELPDVVEFPPAKLPREEQQEAFLREAEIDPALYTPPNVQRDLVLESPPIRIDIASQLGQAEDSSTQ
jgi:ribonuclease Z